VSAVDAPAAPLAARPGRPRNQAAGDAILAATLDLLGRRGYGGLTVCSVIESAGVSSATLYRRWSTKQDLVVAALASMLPEPTTADTGSLAGDLDAFVHQMAESIAARREDVAEALNSEVKTNPELAAALRETFLVPRLSQLADILERAEQRGELADELSAEDAFSLVAGPLYHRAFYLGEPVTEEFVARAVRHGVRGLCGAGARPVRAG
jgi:AcrR family transcriptional regulator